MISSVTYQSATWGELPNRLEAGTPNMAGAIGLGAAIDWLSQLDFAAIKRHEEDLLNLACDLAHDLDGMQVIGNAAKKVGVLSFNLKDIHAADVGFLLDKQNIAIRTGDHCAQPLMQRLGVSGTARASFSLYNTREEVEQLFVALGKAKMMLA
jgi:cysteine desulfurase/selenocysteine lyase